MKTLLITSALFISGIWVTVAIQNDELQDEQLYSAKWANHRLIDSLKREIRFGPKPYCVVHRLFPRTAKQEDSVMRYMSHYTRRELREIKDGIVENLALKGYIDTLLAYKDSLQRAEPSLEFSEDY